jgi:hypothetical protein
MILINKGAGEFKYLRINSLEHRLKTVANFNNDGWLDLAGVRHSEQGAASGRPFILPNSPKLAFSLEETPRRAQDKRRRADLIARGRKSHTGSPQGLTFEPLWYWCGDAAD